MLQQPTLSILILSLLERHKLFLPRLLNSLEVQTKGKPVEVLVLLDNGISEIGAKRNELKRMAKGKYLCFIDDDDRIANNYVSAILGAAKTNPDVIVFDAWVTLNGEAGKVCKYGREFNYENKPDGYYRHPNHLMVHRTENVRDVEFKDVSWQEDDEWAARVLPSIETQERIEDILYFYEYQRTTSRASKRRRR